VQKLKKNKTLTSKSCVQQFSHQFIDKIKYSNISLQVSFNFLLQRWDIWQGEETSHASAALGNVCLETHTVWPLKGSKQFTSSGHKRHQPLQVCVSISLFRRPKL